MPIAGLQPRFAQVGVIRLGQQVPTGRTNSRGDATFRPQKLETFRITSPSKPLVDRVAELYGGEVKPWQHPSGPQFEVITEVREVPVFVPPQVIDPNYEQWGNKYKARQCDGVTECIRRVACLCRQGQGGHVHTFERDACAECGEKRGCKATTRMSLMLAEVQSLGIWKLESHGWNFASEMPMMADAIAAASGPIPGRLELQVREKNVLTIVNGAEKVEPRKFMVAVVHFDEYTPAEAFGAIEGGTRPAINGGQPAIGGGRARAIAANLGAAEGPDWLALIADADSADAVNNLMEQMRSAGVRDQALVDAWKAKAATFNAPAEPASTAPAQPAQPAPARPASRPVPAEKVIDAEVEPDGKAVFDEIIALAGSNGWNMPALEKKFVAHMGFDYRDDRADGWALARFRDAVKAGEVR